MKRYHFALESALRVRRAQEDLARQRLAEANHAVLAARAALEQALAAYRGATASARRAGRDQFVAVRAQEMRYAEGVERAQRTVTELEVQAATCYSAWVEAGKQVASLERLDDRRRDEWWVAARREEAAAVDDIVSARWSPEGAVGGR